MAVKLQRQTYTLIDELEYYTEVYAGVAKPKENFYELWSSFLMDSQYDAVKTTASDKSPERKRRRKRKLGKAPEFLRQHCECVSSAYDDYLKDTNTSGGHTKSAVCHSDNNRLARDAVKKAPTSPPQAIPALEASAEWEQIKLEHGEIPSRDILRASCRLSRPKFIFNNPNNTVIAVRSTDCPAASHLIPPRARFTSTDVRLSLEQFTSEGKNYDLIVMDPPWSNRSVRRKRTYECFRTEDLEELPIKELLSPNGLICMWITNSEMVQSAARRIAEKKWELAFITHWHWLKICRTGIPVYEFRPEHKVPFESLAFLCRKEALGRYKPLLAADHCLISVPNANPSRKPPLAPILRQLGLLPPENSNLLELYARYLLPCTTSVGYEVLKFQHGYFFEPFKPSNK